VNYEAQAAIEMEARVDAKEEGTYPLDVAHDVIDARPLIRAVVSDLRAGAPVETMAARFHNSIVQVTIRICRSMRADYGINQVSLSGGVWQNMVLLDRTVRLLNKEGFELLLHRHVPANDGGVAFGQAVVGLAKLEEE
jgi:hydrogenase maturation protein HypF